MEKSARILTELVEKLSLSPSLEAVTEMITETARELVAADGATFVLRDEDKCYYVDENAISPLWKGKRFPIRSCISGHAMCDKEVIIIPDIYKDSRVPEDAYRPTFVKSMAMIPIRDQDPIGAIGVYWAKPYVPSDDQVKLLQVVANSSAAALENLELKQLVNKKDTTQSGLEIGIQTIVHDMRSPLSTLRLFTEILESKATVAKDKSALTHMKKCCDQMGQQLERMLTLYRAQHKELELQSVNLSQLAEDVWNDIREQDPTRNVQVHFDANLEAVADPFLARLALENLLANAFKYTLYTDQAQIEFGKEAEQDNFATFYIKDNGVGFDPNQAQKLFQPFARLHKEHAFKGTGLGLVSVARIIEMHGGIIKAEGARDKGATFYFSLPTKNEMNIPGRNGF